MIFFAGIFSFCTGTLERDAARLAGLQQEKTGLVKNLLTVSDSASIVHYLENIRMIEIKIRDLKAKCKKKYNDSLQNKAFEKAYKNALIHINKSNH